MKRKTILKMTAVVMAFLLSFQVMDTSMLYSKTNIVKAENVAKSSTENDILEATEEETTEWMEETATEAVSEDTNEEEKVEYNGYLHSVDDPEYFKYLDSEKEVEAVSETDDAIVEMASFTTSSPFKSGKTYTHGSQFEDMDVIHGIDISEWQGDINWSKVKKAGAKYVFVRVGGRYYGSGKLFSDSTYEKNIKGAHDAGLDVGVYIYSQAITPDEGKEEAEYIINKIANYKSYITMPVVLDFEFAGTNVGRLYNAHLTKKEGTDICMAFCKYTKSKGYEPMVYGNKYMLRDYTNYSTIDALYPVWLAQYTTSAVYEGKYTYWQYTSTGSVSGISGDVDCNFYYTGMTVPTSVSLSSKALTLSSGSKALLNATLKPLYCSEEMTWTSSNPAVAYVNQDGKVYAVSRGKTTITVKTKSGKKATCQVDVNDSLDDYEVVDMAETQYVYTGSDIVPSFRIRSKEKLPLKGDTIKTTNMYVGPSSDYEKVYSVPAASKVTIKGTSGTYYAAYYYDGTSYHFGYIEKASVTPTNDYEYLQEDKQYRVVKVDAKEVGDACVRAEGMLNGTIEGFIEIPYKIVQADLTEAEVYGVSDILPGEEVNIDSLEVILNGRKLIKETDYTTELFFDETNQYGKVMIYGIGNYKGIAVKSYKVIDCGIVNISYAKEMEYTGSACIPSLTLETEDGTLAIDNDYTYSCTHNINIGTAAMNVVVNMGEDTYSFSLVYKITPRNISSLKYNPVSAVTYDGTKKHPDISIYYNNTKLVCNKDYTISYSNDVNAGTGNITVSGIGNYTGKKVVTYTINKASIAKATCASISNKTYTGKSICPSATIKMGTKTLKKNVDYKISYSKNKNIGKANVIIEGIGNYSGKKTFNFSIVPKKVSGFSDSGYNKTTIKLKWKKNAGNVTGYQIYCASRYDSKYKKIKTVKSPKLYYKHTGRTKNREYYYKIRAYKVVDGKYYYGPMTSILTGRAKYTTYKGKIQINVNLRKHAGTSYGIVNTISEGKTVTVYGYTYDKSGNKWYRVKYKGKSKTYYGYVFGEYVKLNKK